MTKLPAETPTSNKWEQSHEDNPRLSHKFGWQGDNNKDISEFYFDGISPHGDNHICVYRMVKTGEIHAFFTMRDDEFNEHRTRNLTDQQARSL